MAVDTHVFRASARIRVNKKRENAVGAEKQLLKFLPSDLVHKAHHWLILHGRYICVARKPNAEPLRLTGVCEYYAIIDGEQNFI